jgi:dihydropteroate synthase
MRPCFPWRLRSRELELGRRTLIMGILNVTPDSFSDGGAFLDPARAVSHALDMLSAGADVIDIGGESTRPGAPTEVSAAVGQLAAGAPASGAAVSARQELDRVLPVIAALRKIAPEAVLSIDTYKAEVARAAVEAGVEIVNDVTGLRGDARMTATVAELRCGVVLMHTRGRPEEWRRLPRIGGAIVDLVRRELAAGAQAALDAGVARERIMLDPGFGFGKNFEENYPLLARLDELHRLGFPLLAATSRKSFIARTISRSGEPAPPDARLFGTLATVTAAILRGAHMVRVHDVAPAREAAAVADAILRAEASDESA